MLHHEYIFRKLKTANYTPRPNKSKSNSLAQEKVSDEISRQIRFDPLIQQLEFLIKKCPKQQRSKSLENSLYNPFQFKIKSYQMVQLQSLNVKRKRKQIFSYRNQQPFKLREKSQLTQWERISQEFSESCF